jgi:hypothetical protein
MRACVRALARSRQAGKSDLAAIVIAALAKGRIGRAVHAARDNEAGAT